MAVTKIDVSGPGRWYLDVGGTLEEVERVTTDSGDHDRFKHIIWHDVPGEAAAMVTKAMVEGAPLQAICGKVWVPSRDPERFPLCPECKEIRDEALGGVGDGHGD